MSKPENIKIPYALFERIIYLLDCWDIDEHDPVIQDDYADVYSALLKKKQRLQLRHDYAEIICAIDEDSRNDARLSYLQRKRELYDEFQ
jgi:hypothetical protein